MGVGLCMRSVLALAVLSASLAVPQAARAQGDAPYADANGTFFSALAASQDNQATGQTKISNKAVGSAAPAELATYAKRSPPVPEVSTPSTARSIPAPAYDRESLADTLLTLSPTIWGMIILGLALSAVLLWVVTPLPCLLLGHRRSSKSVRFSDHEDRWLGNCKSCGVLLSRDRQGAWRRAKPTWRRPEIVSGSQVMRWPIAEDASHAAQEPDRAIMAFDRGRNVPVTHSVGANDQERQSSGEAVPVEHRAQMLVSQLLGDVKERNALAPGTRGALFSVVDELRARCATDENTLCAEKISVRMQQLECALQGGDEQEAKLVRRDLRSLAQEWVGNIAITGAYDFSATNAGHPGDESDTIGQAKAGAPQAMSFEGEALTISG